MQNRSKMLSILAASTLLLAACGEEKTTTNSAKTESSVTETQDSSTAATASTEDTEVSTVTEEKVSESTKEEAKTEKSEETTATEAVEKVATTSDSKKEVINKDIKKFIENQIKLGKAGKVEGIPFESGESVFEDITNEWGEPTTSFSNNTNYIEYAENGQVNYAFAVGRGDRIYDIRTFISPSSSFELADIQFEDIEQVAGKPSSITTSGNDQILNYKFGDNIVKFIGPSKTKQLHHISVFNVPSSQTMGGNG
ncbi:MAG: DUF4309 domain-containing protein [Kurthia sp.]|nr:DUF4309 domain-containing protein [Candidatus Kurthia equi]